MSFKFLSVATAVVLMLAGSAASAQVEVLATEVAPSQTGQNFDYEACLQVETAGQTGWGDCSARQLAIEEEAMNLAYNDLVAYASNHYPDVVGDIATMQSVWLPYRDASCDIDYQLDGAMQGALERGQCLVDMTKEQTERLKTLFDRLQHPENYH